MGNAFLLYAMALLAGCATPAKLDTASGKPEVTINAPRSQVKQALANRLVDRQWEINSESEMLVVADHNTSAAADFWFTNVSTGERPRTRIRYTLLEKDGSTRIVASLSFLTAPGFSGRVAETEITDAASLARVQWSLNDLAAKIENRPAPPEPVMPSAPIAASPKAQ